MNPVLLVISQLFGRRMGFFYGLVWLWMASGCQTIHIAQQTEAIYSAIEQEDWQTAHQLLKRVERGENTSPDIWLARAIYERTKPPKPDWFRASRAVLQGLEKAPHHLGLRRERLQQLRSGDPFFGAGFSNNFALTEAADVVLRLAPAELFALESRAIGLWRQFRDVGHTLFPTQQVEEQAHLTRMALEKAFQAGSRQQELTLALAHFYAQRAQKTPFLHQLFAVLMDQKQAQTAYAVRLIVAVRQGQFEQADTLMQQFEAIAPPVVYTALHELDPLLNAEEKAAFQADRTGFTQRFWQERDPRNLTEFSERKIEHTMRVAYADLFGWLGTEKGDVLIRYGFPLTTRRMEEPDKEGWDIGRTAGFERWQYEAFSFGFLALVRQMQNLTTLSEDHRPSKGEQEVLREQTQAGGQFMMPSDLRYFRTPSGETEAIFSLGLPIIQAGKPSPSLKSGLFWRQNNQVVFSTSLPIPADTTFNPLIRLNQQTIFVVADTFQPPKGRFTVQAEVLQQGVFGQSSDKTEVPHFKPNEFGLSDILLAYQLQEVEVGRLLVHRGGYAFQPAPLPIFRKALPVYFYLEAYDLPQNETGERPYTVEALLIPKKRMDTKEDLLGLLQTAFSKQQSGSSVQFSGVASHSSEAIGLGIETQKLPNGPYLLTVRVRANGQERIQSCNLTLE